MFKLLSRSQYGISWLGSSTRGWWVSLLSALLFTAHIHAVRFHLLATPHLHGLLSEPGRQSHRHAGHAEFHEHNASHTHQHHGHKPHAESDHQILLALLKKDSPAPALDLLSWAGALRITPPLSRIGRLPDKFAGLPGESPPNPAQPRAPPFA